MQPVSRDQPDRLLRAPPNVPPAPLMVVNIAIACSLVRRRGPPIRFSSIGSRLCSTLPSNPASRRCPCASLSLFPARMGRGLPPPSGHSCTAHQERPVRSGRRVSLRGPFFSSSRGWASRCGAAKKEKPGDRQCVQPRPDGPWCGRRRPWRRVVAEMRAGG